MELLRGRTSQIIPVRIVDSNGLPKTGLVFNTTGLSAAYQRELDAAPTTITLATMTAGTWATGGFIELNSTSMPGVYAVGLPNAAISAADASTWSVIQFVGTVAANLYAQPIRIDLVAVNVQDAVRYGLTALPNANAEATGGLYTRGTGAGQINQDANGRVDTNVKAWIGGTIPAVNVTGVPKVDVLDWLGTTVSTPATAGIPDVNAKNINNVATSSVTTINANVGSTQPVNFTGTGASALAKSDMVDVAGAAVSTSTAQIGVNAVNIGGTAQTGRDIGATLGIAGAGLTALGDARIANLDATISSRLAPTVAARTLDVSAAGEAGLDWANIGAPTTVVDLSGTTIKNVDNAIATVTNLTNAPTSGDFTATMKTSLNASTPASVQNIAAQTGDSFARLGVPVGASVSADIAGTLHSTVVGRTLDVAATGEAGLDFNNVNQAAAPTTLSNITVPTVTVTGTATNLTNAASSGDFTAAMKASLNASTPASVTTVTGNVNGNILGNIVGSVANVLAFAQAALAQMFTTNTGETYADSVPGSVVYEIAQNAATDITPVLNRLPTTLVGGKMDSHVNDIATDAINASALAVSAVTEIQSGLGTAANQTTINNNVLAVQADTDDIQMRLPAALVSGRMNSSVHDFQTAALAQFFTTDTGETGSDAVPGSIVYEIASDIVISTDTSSFSGAAAVQIDEMQAKLDSLNTAQLTAISPTGPGATIQVTRGMDYYSADGFAYSFTLPESGADLTGAAGTLYISTGGTPLAISSHSLNAVTRVVVFELTHAESAKAAGTTCEIDVTLANTHIWKVAVGTMTVITGLSI